MIASTGSVDHTRTASALKEKLTMLNLRRKWPISCAVAVLPVFALVAGYARVGFGTSYEVPIYVIPFETRGVGLDASSEVALKQVITDFHAIHATGVCVIAFEWRAPAGERIVKSRETAESVADYLVTHGIPASSLTTIWKGDAQMTAQTSEDPKEAGRRVEILLSGENWRFPCS